MHKFEIRVLHGQDIQVYTRVAKLPVGIVGGNKHLIVEASASAEDILVRNLSTFAEVRRL